MTSFRLAWREMGHRPIFPALFVLSTAVGIASLLALVSVGAAVKKVVVEHARELWAADITVKGSPPLLASTEGWVNVRWPGVRTARTVDSLSMARLRSGQAFQVSVSALSSNYPLYGKITTRSGRPLQDVLRPGWVVVGENLLARWHVSLGDEIRLGESRFRVADALVSRTDAPVSFFELSPTVLLTLDDLTSSRLLSPGSRSLNVLYINLPSEVDFESALADVKRHTVEESAEVSGWSTDNPGVFRFLQNVLDNLDFLALLTLLLGGLGAATALSAARAAATRDIGTLFALGAPRGFVLRSWAVWIGTLTAAGVLLALPVGQGVARVLLLRLGDLLPPGVSLGFPIQVLASSLTLGAAVIVFFAFVPLVGLGDVSPNVIFTNDIPRLPRRPFRSAVLGGVGVLLFWGVAFFQWKRPVPAGQFVGGVLLLWAVAQGAVSAILTLLRRGFTRSSSVVTRLAARGLSRPGSLNDAAVVSVALSLGAILTLMLVEKNLTLRWVNNGAVETPNVFFINLQESQIEPFRRLMGRPDARLFPLIRGRVVAVNGLSVQEVNRRTQKQGDRLTREFGFTYGSTLLPTDKVVEGGGLWNSRVEGPQVSVFEDYKKRFGLRLGDKITVNVLGRRFDATIVSFRAINHSARQPFFYFYFQPGLLESVPHTWMGGLTIPPEDLPALQNALTEAFPNVTVIDFSEVASLSAKIIARLGRVVNVLSVFGLFSGVVLLISSLSVTLVSRVRESALYRTLGATRGQVARVALLEYVWVGAVSAGVAWGLAQGTAGFLLRRLFDVSLSSFPKSTGLLLGAAVGGWVLLSWIVTRGAFRVRPLEILRHE